MKSRIAFVLAASLSVLAGARLPAANFIIRLGQIEEPIAFGTLINTPNGHISFLKHGDGYRLWVAGRLENADVNEEGGFVMDVNGWTTADLAAALPALALGHNQDDCVSSNFDRNYAALNAIVPGADPGTLIGFYDAEFHPICGEGQPLLSSIGVAVSSDGGQTWEQRQQALQGLDEARDGFEYVVGEQVADWLNGRILDSGASGPSAIVRQEPDGTFIYLYYADRTPLTGGDDSIYVARAPLGGALAADSWQKWDGTSWGAPGDQANASPIVVPPPGGAALQPHVSWNTMLGRWLMVFKTGHDFEVATSTNGVHWTPPSSLLAFDPNDKATGFPTFVTPRAQLCSLACGEVSTQQVTGATGWLFYSSLPQNGTRYIGHRVPFRIE